MTRAELAALKAYPDNEVLFFAQDDEGKNHPVTTFGREINGFIFGYDQAEKDLGWINVKDRLPEKDTVVLTCWDVNGVPQGIGLRLYDGQWQDFDEDDDIEISDPDYWMPIPQFNK